MVRGAYNWNKIFDDGVRHARPALRLLGDERRPRRLSAPDQLWIADFRRLYDFPAGGHASLGVPAAKFNRAMRIDTTLVNPLQSLPGFSGVEANLAFRNLTRANMVKLATGQQMVTFLTSKGISITKLTKAQTPRRQQRGADLGRPHPGTARARS